MTKRIVILLLAIAPFAMADQKSNCFRALELSTDSLNNFRETSLKCTETYADQATYGDLYLSYRSSAKKFGKIVEDMTDYAVQNCQSQGSDFVQANNKLRHSYNRLSQAIPYYCR